MSEQRKKISKGEVDLPIIRMRVARDLEPLVAKYFMLGPSFMTSSNTTTTLSNEKKIELISRVLEAKLYAESAPSLETYRDPTTLEARFQNVVARINAHRPAKKRKGTAHTTSSLSSSNSIATDGSTLESSSKAVSSSSNDRNLSIHNKQRMDRPTTQKEYHALLRSHVGEALYNKIQSVSLELHVLRQAYSNWFDVMKDQMLMNQPAQEDLQQSRAEDLVPKVLQQLYFHNPLLRALGHLNVTTDTVDIKRVTGPNWHLLVQEAESIQKRVKDLNRIRPALSIVNIRK